MIGLCWSIGILCFSGVCALPSPETALAPSLPRNAKKPSPPGVVHAPSGWGSFGWDVSNFWDGSNSWDASTLPPHEEDKGQHRVFTENFAATHPELSKKAFKNKEALWPKAAVIYEADPSVGCPFSDKCKLLMDAMNHYREKTCIRFKERSGERDYVNIFVNRDRGACYSTLGRVGGVQQVSLGGDCWHEGIVIHELGHALSFPDEQNRPDRDDWVWIFWENVLPHMRQAFAETSFATTNLLEEPFDYNSIMMYDEYGFSKDGESPTMRAKTNEHLRPVWSKEGLSSLDVLKLTKLYRCQGANQKPRFPVDITCSFDGDLCGFKGVNNNEYNHWQWKPKPWGLHFFASSGGGYLFTTRDTTDQDTPKAWSINFHGLSPTDTERGPLGCLSFSYYISADGRATLTVLQTILDTPYEIFYHKEAAKELWSFGKNTPKWNKAQIPIQVTRPFMVEFGSNYGAGTNRGTIQVDDFELKYTPCEQNPGNSPQQDRPLRRSESRGSRTTPTASDFHLFESIFSIAESFWA